MMKILNLPQNVFQQTIIFAVVLNITKYQFIAGVEKLISKFDHFIPL